MKNVAIVYFSSGGHTQKLAHGIAEGVRSVPQTSAVLWRIEGSMIQAMQHGMLWVGLGIRPEGSSPEQINRLGSYLGLMAQSEADQTNLFEGDRQTARLFGQRIADATHRWKRT